MGCGEFPQKNFQVRGTDPDKFDRDRDGFGCENWHEFHSGLRRELGRQRCARLLGSSLSLSVRSSGLLPLQKV